MKLLIIGGGGREHAIIRKLKQSPKIEKLYCAPGNGGIANEAQCIPVAATDIPGVLAWLKENPVDLVFVAPDDPLAAGMVDALTAAGIPAFGPEKLAAEIEGSKVFAKDLMKRYQIPTADYESFSDVQAALAYMRSRNRYPVVIKADGLALGKGVVIAEDQAQGERAIRQMMEDKIFGESGNRLVIEEFLIGKEVSVLAFTDGVTVCPMVSAKDHKRAYDGDRGPNTGGMGAVSPSPDYTQELAAVAMERIFRPTVKAMAAEGRSFRGVLYFGLILTEEGPKVIEYNARFGDPEAQVVLPRLETDLVEIIQGILAQRLDQLEIRWSSEACACVVMASGGYPGSYEKGIGIRGLGPDGQLADSETEWGDGTGQKPVVYHSGTRKENGSYRTNGGRVLGVTAKGKDLTEALNLAYEGVAKISFEGAMCRKDIGQWGGK